MTRSITRREALGRGAVVLGSLTLLAGCSDGGEGTQEEGDDTGAGESGEGEANDTNDTEQPAESEDTEQSDEADEPADESAEGETQAIRLVGVTDGWQGQEPAEIAEETNPALTLRTGTTYELTWENGDGMEHELVIADGEGAEIEVSDAAEEEGETVTLTFDATEEMATYYCEYHPEAMRGEVTVE